MAEAPDVEEVVEEFLARQREMYAGGDLAAVGALLAEDVVWHVPGTSPIAGEYRGREAVVGYFRLRRVDNRRMDYMRSLFGAFCPDEDDVEVRCMVFYSLWIGSHFIAADHGARSRADVLKLTLKRLEAW